MIDSKTANMHHDTAGILMNEAQAARSTNDWRALIRIGGELERLGSYAEAWLALAEGSEIRKGTVFPNWAGPDAPSERLLIRRRIRHLGAELRNARFIGCALHDVAEVTVATEARLIQLLQRSFPSARFIDAETISTLEGPCVESSYERLAFHYGADEQSIRDSFAPLIPPPSAAGAPTGIGIAWHSSNCKKLLPEIEDWAAVLSSIDIPVKSLQYGEEEAGIVQLSELSRRYIEPSMPIDQMVDVDGFAGQTASVKGVLTISNTTAHMAGALGIPCVVILDNMSHLTWPGIGDQSPFYPSIRIIRQNGRPWPEVIDAGIQTLHKLTQL